MALLEEAGAERPRRGARARRRATWRSSRHAFDRERGRFRNFMSYARRWIEERRLRGQPRPRAVGARRRRRPLDAIRAGRAWPASCSTPRCRRSPTFTSPRAWAYALLGIDEYLRAFEGDSSVEAVRSDARRAAARPVHARRSRPDWPWFEDRVTYCNAQLPQALIVSGRLDGPRRDDGGRPALARRGWSSIQRSPDGYFAPVGSNGFYQRGGDAGARSISSRSRRARWSRPASRRSASTGDARWARARAARLRLVPRPEPPAQSLYDPSTGGCRDGLHADRANENQGAESTLVVPARARRDARRPIAPTPSRRRRCEARVTA